MRIIILFLCTSLLACSHTGPVRLYPGETLAPKQEVKLVLPDALELLQVNEEAVPASTFAFRTGAADLRLPPGPNRLTVQYRTIWDVAADQHEIVESGPIEFLVDLTSNQSYQFEWQEPTTIDAAVQFANNPTIRISGNQASWLGHHKPKQSDLILIADPSTTTNESKSNIALDKLQYWWRRANLDEQKAFLQSIKAAN